ncbi:PaaX family transcriptional regulator C-terminal domain-containing protein [Prauserella oleivorans]|uniref:PaaX family transcriptional regulator C-terminal domain-containing protein n=1 Tax=Prauserella oleivorans TaxID=1478153 RepID=A0ABW5W9I6_9PSEU
MSARSVLMTLLGEFVLPRDRPVWTSVLVDALGMFDVEEKSARQALARTAAEGWIASERVGRRVRWSLTEPGRVLLSEGARRIYDFGSASRSWDGRWLVVLVSVPEARRDLRHQLRTKLTWAGFGSPAPGVWVTPHPSREEEALGILSGLGLHDAISFVGPYGAIGDESSMVATAWDLRGLVTRYQEFVEVFGSLAPKDDDAVLDAQTRLVHEWRRFPFLDPQLPSVLLPENWSGAQAADLFHRRHAEWNPVAQRRWDERVADVEAA